MSQPRLAARVAALQPTAVNQVLREVKQLQAEGKDLISLMRGQPDTATAGHIVEAAMRALNSGRTGYPDNQGEPNLRQAVAQKLARDQQAVYDPDQEILITDGATGGISTALGALIQEGDEVLLPDPIYDAYTSPIRLWGGTPVPVPSVIGAGRFVIERSALEDACTSRTRVVLINSPWNPVGTLIARDELQMIVDVARERDLILLSDEIYEKLVYDNLTHVSPASLASAATDRTVLVNSLSKTYAMTGWRVGYIAAPRKLIEPMLMVWQQSSRGPATFVQDAATVALISDQSEVGRMAKEYEARRDLTMQRLNGIPGVHVLRPQGGLFVMLDVRELGMPSNAIRRFLLIDAGVVVIHGAAYGAGGEGTLRVSFAAGGQILERGLERLREGLVRLTLSRKGAG